MRKFLLDIERLQPSFIQIAFLRVYIIKLSLADFMLEINYWEKMLSSYVTAGFRGFF